MKQRSLDDEIRILRQFVQGSGKYVKLALSNINANERMEAKFSCDHN